MILDSFRIGPDLQPEKVSMIEALGTVLAGLAAIIVCGLIIVCGVVWASKRRMGQAVEQAAEAEQQKAGGGGGPKPVK